MSEPEPVTTVTDLAEGPEEPGPQAPERAVLPIIEHDTVPAVFAAICEVMNSLGAIGKDNHSDHGNFKFRGVDDVMNALAPVMRSHCLFITPRVIRTERTRLSTKGGGGLMNTVVHVEYGFISGADGSKHTVGPIIGEGMDTGDKSGAKAMSVALRTMLLQVFMIPTQDRDPDHDVYEVAPDQPPAAPRQRPEPAPRVRASRPTPADQDADPWADDNPERVTYYREAITASGSDDSLRLVWDEVAAACQSGTLSAKDGRHLSSLVKQRLSQLAAAREAAAAADPEAPFHTA